MTRLRRAVLIVVIALAVPAASGYVWHLLRPPPLVIAAYTVPWDADRGLESLRRHGDAITTVSPVWYTPTDDGRVVRNDTAPTAPTADAARRRDLPLVPAISNFRDGAWDADVIHTIVTDRDRMAAHVDAIADVVDEAGWDGIDLDYESLRGEDRDAYSAFARTLGERLRSMGRQLTITVQAKTSEQGTAGFHAAQDYEALAAAADELRIMAYDRHWSGSDPGPIAPVAWVEEA